MKRIVMYLLITLKAFSLDINYKELKKIGELIYINEAGGRVEDLIDWNEGEEFPSLGIGHFIWYPKGYEGPFEESFPSLKEVFERENIEIPKIFEDNDAPWTDRRSFIHMKRSGNNDISKGIDFLNKTKEVQIIYISRRLGKAIPLIMKNAGKKEHVKKVLYELLKEPFAMYPLLDYVNFKGEGLKKEERYKGEGWGLLQVLENMEIRDDMIKSFEDSAKLVLAKRVGNAPKDRKEYRWLEGWYNRLETYVTERDKFLAEE